MTTVTDHGSSQTVSVQLRGERFRVTTDIWQYDHNNNLHVGLTINTADIALVETLIADLQVGVAEMKANRA